jgi:hypothetical protein
MVSFALTQFKVKILFYHEEREGHEGFVISVIKLGGLRVLRDRFFSGSILLRKFLHPSEIGNFHGDVIGIQQNCQLHDGI